MHQDLIERYIYAVTKTLPARMREDVEKELHSLISDMLEERCQDMPPTEHDVLVVLTELGRPAELAAKYRPERASYLIGPGYYAAYKFLLGLVLAAVAFGLAVASVITACAAAQPWYLALGQYLAQTFQALLCSFGGITLAFAVLERKGVRMNLGEQDIAHLPPVPKKQERIPKAEPIVGIVFCILFAFQCPKNTGGLASYCRVHGAGRAAGKRKAVRRPIYQTSGCRFRGHKPTFRGIVLCLFAGQFYSEPAVSLVYARLVQRGCSVSQYGLWADQFDFFGCDPLCALSGYGGNRV